MSLNPFPSIKRGSLAFVGWIHAAFCALLTEEGRKGWAVIIAWGCGIAMTAYAAASLYLVRRSPMLAFWLGLSAMFIVLVVITAFTGLLIKRSVKAKYRDGEIALEDHDSEPAPVVTLKAEAKIEAPKAPGEPPAA